MWVILYWYPPYPPNHWSLVFILGGGHQFGKSSLVFGTVLGTSAPCLVIQPGVSIIYVVGHPLLLFLNLCSKTHWIFCSCILLCSYRVKVKVYCWILRGWVQCLTEPRTLAEDGLYFKFWETTFITRYCFFLCFRRSQVKTEYIVLVITHVPLLSYIDSSRSVALKMFTG